VKSVSKAPDRAKVCRQRYRAEHRRFDYYPSPSALAAIERNIDISNCIAGVLDCLIEEGAKAFSGNMENQVKC
jgi:hypothetical protein